MKTASDMARALRCSRQRVNQIIRQRGIKPIKQSGRAFLYRDADLNRLLNDPTRAEYRRRWVNAAMAASK